MLTIQFTYPNGKETYEFPYDTTLEEVLCVPNGMCQKWDDVEFYRKLKGIDGRVNHEYDRLPPGVYERCSKCDFYNCVCWWAEGKTTTL